MKYPSYVSQHHPIYKHDTISMTYFRERISKRLLLKMLKKDDKNHHTTLSELW